MALLHDGASRKRDIGMARAAPQYDRPSLAKTVRLTNIPALATSKRIRPPQVLKVSCACRVIGEYPLKFWERRWKTTRIHYRNSASEYLIGNKPDRRRYNNRQGFIDTLLRMSYTSHIHMLQKLRSAIQNSDLAAIAFIAHALKGTAGNLEARGIRGLATETEDSVRAGRPDHMVLTEELARLLERLLAELARYLERSSGSAQ